MRLAESEERGDAHKKRAVAHADRVAKLFGTIHQLDARLRCSRQEVRKELLDELRKAKPKRPRAGELTCLAKRSGPRPRVQATATAHRARAGSVRATVIRRTWTCMMRHVHVM